MLSNYTSTYPVYVFCLCSKFILIMNTTELSQRLHICSFLITLYLYCVFLSLLHCCFGVFLVLLYYTYAHVHIPTYTHIYTHIHTHIHIHSYTHILIQTHSHLCTYKMCFGSIHKNNTCK